MVLHPRAKLLPHCTVAVQDAIGVIDVALERETFDVDAVNERVEGIGATLSEIFARAERESCNTSKIADQIARERFVGKQELRKSA